MFNVGDRVRLISITIEGEDDVFENVKVGDTGIITKHIPLGRDDNPASYVRLDWFDEYGIDDDILNSEDFDDEMSAICFFDFDLELI